MRLVKYRKQDSQSMLVSSTRLTGIAGKSYLAFTEHSAFIRPHKEAMLSVLQGRCSSNFFTLASYFEPCFKLEQQHLNPTLKIIHREWKILSS